MKSILICLLLILSTGLIGQVEEGNVYFVPDSDTKYDRSIYPPAIIINKMDLAVWIVNDIYPGDSSLNTTSNKVKLTNNTGVEEPIFTSLVLTPQNTFPSSPVEGMLVLMQMESEKRFYVYQDSVWQYYMPINKSINGVKISIKE